MPVIYSQCNSCSARLRFNVQRTSGQVRVKCPKCNSLNPIQIEDSLEDVVALDTEPTANPARRPSGSAPPNRPTSNRPSANRPSPVSRPPHQPATTRPTRKPAGLEGVFPPAIPATYPTEHASTSSGGWDIPAPTFKPKEYEFDPRFVIFPLIGLLILGVGMGAIYGITQLYGYLKNSSILVSTLGGHPGFDLTVNARELNIELNDKLTNLPAPQRSTEGIAIIDSYREKMLAIQAQSMNLPETTLRLDSLAQSIRKAMIQFEKDGIVPDPFEIIGEVPDVETKLQFFQDEISGNEFGKAVREFNDLYHITVSMNRGCRVLEDPFRYRGRAVAFNSTDRRKVGCESMATKFYKELSLHLMRAMKDDDLSATRMNAVGKIIDRYVSETVQKVSSSNSDQISNATVDTEKYPPNFGQRLIGLYKNQLNLWRTLTQKSMSDIENKFIKSPEGLSEERRFLVDQVRKAAQAFAAAAGDKMTELNELAGSTYQSRYQERFGTSSENQDLPDFDFSSTFSQ